MKWILTIPIVLLLSSCLFVEGQIIEEPEDVVVTSSVEKFAVWDKCGLVDVTKADPSG